MRQGLDVRQILAVGGGGFGTAGGGPRLLDYLLELTGKPQPRICYVPTASADSDVGVVRFYREMSAERCIPSDLLLFNRNRENVRDVLLRQDAIWVGGGNTANMLAIWRVHGVDRVLREAWERGIVLGGVSAGGLCWFDDGITDSFGPDLAALHDGLGFLPGSFCPHYNSEPGRRPTYHRLVAAGMPAGYALDDGVGLHFIGRDLAAIVAENPSARAYRLEREGNRAVEMPLEPGYLGPAPTA